MNASRARQQAEANFQLMLQKSADYGTRNLETTGPYGIAVRLQDKVSRLLNITAKGGTPNFESVMDTFGDVANYGLLGQLLVRHGELGGGDGDRTPVPAPPTQTPVVYLAGPIDQVSVEESTKWREVAAQALEEVAITVSPRGMVAGGAVNDGSAVMALCRAVVPLCSHILTYLPRGVPALGTIREIEYARGLGLPVHVVGDWVSASAFSADLTVHHSLANAIEYLIDEFSV